MSNSFSAMKKSKSSYEDLAEKLEKTKSNKNYTEDERFYYPERDKAKNGFAIIRFLPAPDGEELPWVKRYSHGFKDVGGWYIEECATTIGEECPVCKANSLLVSEHGSWNDTPAPVKAIVRARKRKLQYYANIYVVQDSKNPENEGQVRLFKFGMKIFDKLMSAVKPEFEDESPIDPFDLWSGANFKLKIRVVDKMTNYDSSEFEATSQLLPTDKELEAVWKSQHSLTKFVEKDQYKEYNELEKRRARVVGGTVNEDTAEDRTEDAASVGNSAQDKFGGDNDAKTEEVSGSSDTAEAGADGDDTMSYFQELADQD